MSLSRDQIVEAANKEHEPVTVSVPEWGGDVLMRPLSVGDQEYLDSITPAADTPRRKALRAVLYSIVDGNGKSLFEATDADLEWIEGARAKTILRLLEVFNQQNRNLEEAVEAFEQAPLEGNATG